MSAYQKQTQKVQGEAGREMDGWALGVYAIICVLFSESSGICIPWPVEHGQKNAFLETRNKVGHVSGTMPDDGQ